MGRDTEEAVPEGSADFDTSLDPEASVGFDSVVHYPGESAGCAFRLNPYTRGGPGGVIRVIHYTRETPRSGKDTGAQLPADPVVAFGSDEL